MVDFNAFMTTLRALKAMDAALATQAAARATSGLQYFAMKFIIRTTQTLASLS